MFGEREVGRAWVGRGVEGRGDEEGWRGERATTEGTAAAGGERGSGLERGEMVGGGEGRGWLDEEEGCRDVVVRRQDGI